MKLIWLLLLPSFALALQSTPSGNINQHDGAGNAITSTATGGHTGQDFYIIGGSGIQGPTGATGATGAAGTNGANGLVQTPDLGVTLIDHFVAATGVGNLGWSTASSGTGSGSAAETNPPISSAHVGVIGCYTGSTTTGRCGIHLGTQIITGGGVITFEEEINVPTLSTLAQEYIDRGGIFDITTAVPTAGIWFDYDRLNLGANWQCRSAHASSITTTDSAVQVTAAWHKLKIVVNASGSSADFYVDGTKVCTNNATMPTTGDLLGIFPLSIFKSAGSTTTAFKIDYLYYNEVFTTPL